VRTQLVLANFALMAERPLAPALHKAGTRITDGVLTIITALVFDREAHL